MKLERRLAQPWWLSVAVPVGSLVVAFAVMGVVLKLTGHSPWETYRKIVEAGFTGSGALSATLISATPILFTGLAAAVAFRMQLFNIGAEGQLYLGAVGASWIALRLGDQDVTSTPLFVIAMCAAAAVLGALWALIPGVLRAFARTNEIITSLMLNYVAGLLLTYLIFDSSSYWRDTSTLQARAFPQGKPMPVASDWSTFGTSVVVPLGFLIGILVAVVVWVLYSRMRFGFEVGVIADSPRAARYAGMRTRRKILAVMALSGAIAGIGGASQIGDFTHTLDGSPTGLQAAAFGYTGIVVAALARYNPFAVCLVAVLIGGLLNAGYTLQGPDFPSGLVGVMQGIILFCALGARAAAPLPRADPRAARRKADCGGARREHQRQPARDRARAGGSLRDAAPVRGARRAPGRAFRRPQPRGRGDDALRRRDRVLDDAAGRRLRPHRSLPGGRCVGARRGGHGGDPRVPRHHAPREPDRLRARAHHLRRRAGTVRLRRHRARARRHPAVHQFGDLDVLGLGDLPVLGPILFDQSALVYASWGLTVLVALYLGRTRFGLNVRAVGEAPASADAMGINVTLYRYVHVLVGGAFAGVAGACYSLSITPGWTAGDTLVGGAGWIAIALVIFAFWRAELCLVGAYLFGALSALPFALQARDVDVTPEFLYALPYVMTIVVLVLVSTGLSKRRLGAPAALGVPYVREER